MTDEIHDCQWLADNLLETLKELEVTERIDTIVEVKKPLAHCCIEGLQVPEE